MTNIFAAAEEVQLLLQRCGWRFCIIGGLAVQRWGEPRFTQDVDLTLLTGFGREENFVSVLLEHFRPRRPDAQAFALQNRVLLAVASNEVPLDISLGAVPFEERSIERASPWEQERGLVTCSAEDLIVHKTFAGRDRDWSDVEGVLVRQHGKLDLKMIRTELKPLAEAKEEPGILTRLESLMNKVDAKLGSKR